MSHDGAIIVQVVDQGSLYISTNSGSSFAAIPGTLLPSTLHWRSIGCSMTCQYILATVVSPYSAPFVSNNFGATFTQTTLPLSPGSGGQWQEVAISADGSTMLTTWTPPMSSETANSGPWTSYDYGVTWTHQTGSLFPMGTSEFIWWSGAAITPSGYMMVGAAMYGGGASLSPGSNQLFISK
jgi:hypothetical protein